MKFTTKHIRKSTRPCIPYMITLDCICGGVYRSEGIREDDKILHKCDKCGDKIYTYQEYPQIEYETFGNNPVDYNSTIIHIEDKETGDEI